MTCSCPKCDAIIDVDLARVSRDGRYTSCPSCKSRFWAQKESFINRAFRKEAKFYCVECDAELGLLHICTQCSTLMPDYCLVQKTKPPQRKVDRSFDIGFNLFSGGGKSSSSTYRSSSRTGPAGRSLYIKLAVFFAIVALSLAGYLFNEKLNEQSVYVENYVRVLHGLKSGADRSSNVFLKMRETVGYFPSSQEVEVINTAKAEIDKRMQLLEKYPDKYSDQTIKIKELYSAYSQLFNLSITPTPDINKAIALENTFNKKALALKSSLTPEFTVELKKSTTKYKNMGIFID